MPSHAAYADGFSNDEIAQFTQLLCSPKKAPPSKYQCHICYRSGHYISDCPMVNGLKILSAGSYGIIKER